VGYSGEVRGTPYSLSGLLPCPIPEEERRSAVDQRKSRLYRQAKGFEGSPTQLASIYSSEGVDRGAEMKWEAAYRCVVCKKEMSFETKMGCYGTCPYCGNSTRGTVVDCEKGSRRLVSSSGLFRRRPEYEYKWDSEVSPI
jgi:DNA-directed RNA polymerase subunit RPC12/RpoP